MTDRLNDVKIATGLALDQIAALKGIPPRSRGEPDDAFRARIWHKIKTDSEQMAVYRLAGFNGYAHRVIAEFKQAHKLDYLSPELCRDLADRIVNAMQWAADK